MKVHLDIRVVTVAPGYLSTRRQRRLAAAEQTLGSSPESEAAKTRESRSAAAQSRLM